MQKLILVLIAFLLSGCSFNEEKIVYSLRVQQFRCLNAFLDPQTKNQTHSLRCNGSEEKAGVLYIKLYPNEKIGLVKVAVQDPKNTSVNVYKISNCYIYDSKNWSCFSEWAGKDTFIQHHAQDGIYSLEYGSNSTGDHFYYSGFIDTGFIATILSWLD
jgi:uncharacterized protein YcfL